MKLQGILVFVFLTVGLIYGEEKATKTKVKSRSDTFCTCTHLFPLLLLSSLKYNLKTLTLHARNKKEEEKFFFASLPLEIFSLDMINFPRN